VLYFGSQFYRPPNPRRQDWERDLDTLAGLGFNVIKIWAMWTWTHIAPGRFDFSDLAQLLDLAGKRKLNVIINTIPENAPYWLEQAHPEARQCDHTGMRVHLQARPNTPCGGWPGLCLDNEPVRHLAGEWFAAIGREFKGHPALYGYDIWNETFFELGGYYPGRRFCYCDATVAKFREHMKKKYGSLQAINEAWVRRYSDWAQVEPPRFFGSYPDHIDWIEWRLQNQIDQMSWRIKSIKKGDRNVLITSHGICGTLGLLPTHLNPDWGMAELVEQWGASSFPGYSSPLSWAMARVDLTRSNVRPTPGKKFWQTELQGGRCNGLVNAENPDSLRWEPITRPGHYRLWNWTSLAGGAKGLMYWQWRNEILGPESPGFGVVGLDGTPNENTEAAAWFARLAAEHPEIEDADPIEADLAIVVADEAQIFAYVAESNTRLYTEAVMGAHAALVDGNLCPDFARPADLADYKTAYLPLPVMLTAETARALTEFVEGGGLLICEAAPAHFVEGGFCSPVVPGQGLTQLFGARAVEVESVAEGITIAYGGLEAPAPLHQMRLRAEGADVLATWPDGSAAVTANKCGSGTAVLVGGYPSIAYSRGAGEAGALIRKLLGDRGCPQAVATSSPDVKARLHKNAADGSYLLYVINEGEADADATISVSPEAARFAKAEAFAGRAEPSLSENSISLRVPAREGTLIRLSA